MSFSEPVDMSNFETSNVSIPNEASFPILQSFQTNNSLENISSSRPVKRLNNKKKTYSLQNSGSSDVLGTNYLFLNQRSDQEIINRRKYSVQKKHHSGEINVIYEENSIARAKSRLSRQNTLFVKVY